MLDVATACVATLGRELRHLRQGWVQRAMRSVSQLPAVSQVSVRGDRALANPKSAGMCASNRSQHLVRSC